MVRLPKNLVTQPFSLAGDRMSEKQLDLLINEVIKQLENEGLISRKSPDILATSKSVNKNEVDPIIIDLEDPTSESQRTLALLNHPMDTDALSALVASTTARIGVGRAGTRPRIESLLLFQSDFAVSQDALYKEVNPEIINKTGLFSVNTMVTGGKMEYLLRPDLGRSLSKEAIAEINQRCIKKPDIQICVGAGLSATAIEANIEKIFPVLVAGCKYAGLSLGTPFFIQNCRVGVMNDIGDIIQPDVLILLIGERPGLGRAESMSVYMAYQPKHGHTDANREVICNIFDNGGTNPLEAGAYAIQMALEMIRKKRSGVG